MVEDSFILLNPYLVSVAKRRSRVPKPTGATDNAQRNQDFRPCRGSIRYNIPSGGLRPRLLALAPPGPDWRSHFRRFATDTIQLFPLAENSFVLGFKLPSTSLSIVSLASL